MSHFLLKREGFQNKRWNSLNRNSHKKELYRIVNNIKTTLTNRFPYSIFPSPSPQDQDRMCSDRNRLSIPVNEQLYWTPKAFVAPSLCPEILIPGSSQWKSQIVALEILTHEEEGTPRRWFLSCDSLSLSLWSPLQGEMLGPIEDWFHLWGAVRLTEQGPALFCPSEPRTWNHW